MTAVRSQLARRVPSDDNIRMHPLASFHRIDRAARSPRPAA